jgi:hypothetical protein
MGHVVHFLLSDGDRHKNLVFEGSTIAVAAEPVLYRQCAI